MASEKRKKNNEARMRVYEKEKEEEAWKQYEYFIVIHHYEKHKHITWHWSNTPEEHLYNAGYINDYNKHRLERLAKYKEGVNRHKDYGLDGFALDSTNVYHGIQTKYYTSNKVCANDIGTFGRVVLRMNKKNSLSKGYLYTTTKLEETLAEDIEHAKDIIHEKVLFETEDKRKTRHKKEVSEVQLPLREYQNQAIESLNDERESKAVLSLFCGGGKTLIAGHYLSKLKPKTIVVLAPLKVSVDNLEVRLTPFLENYETLVVDSDSGNTTDADVVRSKLEEDKPLIIFSTFDSAENVLSELFEDEELLEDSFILVDEVHNILNKQKLCEFIDMFYDGLLMSATIPEELYEVVDCEPVYEYGMSEAIKNGYCVDYNVWLPQIVKKEEGNAIEIDIPEGFEKSDLCAKVLFLVTGMLQTGSKRCIVYLRNKDECATFNELFAKVCKEYHGLNSWTNTIDCDVKKGDRRTILEEFQIDKDDLTTLHVISSVRILDEAVDVVRCDSEFITYVGEKADDKRAIQRLQRGGRLDSLNISKKNNLFIWCNEYSKMLNMLSLLKESDPEFHTKLRVIDGSYDSVGKRESIEVSTVQVGDLQKYVEVGCLSADDIWEIKRKKWIELHNNSNNSNNIKKTILKWQSHQRNNYILKILSKDRIDILNKTDGWAWKIDREYVWDNMLKKVIEYYNENRKFPAQCKGKLGGWVGTQRKNYVNNEISDKRIEKLNKLEWWIWDLDQLWNKTLEKTIEYYNENKKFPPCKTANKSEEKLNSWISKQRENYKMEKLSIERIEKLNKLDWWLWEFNREDIWNQKLQTLIKYYNENKKIPSSKSKNEIEKELGSWIGIQRRKYKDNELSKERIEKINNLEWWKWGINIEDIWNENLQKVIEYYNENKKFPLSKTDNKSEEKIGKWVGTQRTLYKNNELSKERINKLNKLEWWVWDELNEKWNETYQILIAYYSENNKLPKSRSKNKMEIKINGWIDRQKRNYKNNELSKERIEMLKTLDWWKW